MTQYTTLLVGAHFRPPAKQLLQFLAAGTPLSLEEENDNSYDAEAVRVYVDPRQVPDSQLPALEAILPDAGTTLEQLMSAGPVWLGFVPASAGKPLAKARVGEPGLIGNHEVRELMGPTCKATLGFGPDGTPRCLLSVGIGIEPPSIDEMEVNENVSGVSG